LVNRHLACRESGHQKNHCSEIDRDNNAFFVRKKTVHLEDSERKIVMVAQASSEGKTSSVEQEIDFVKIRARRGANG
jgi:hypothetical protein